MYMQILPFQRSTKITMEFNSLVPITYDPNELMYFNVLMYTIQ